MLRNRTIREIHETIAQGQYFKSGDFNVVTTDDKRGITTLLLEYRYDTTFFLKMDVPTERNPQGIFLITGQVSPGELSGQEPANFGGMDGLKRGISDWLNRVRSEISAAPVVRQIIEQEEQLSEFRSQLADLPNEFFTSEEAAQLRQRLQDLEVRLLDNLKQNVSDKVALSAKLQEVATDIQMLKDSVGSSSKPGWLGALSARTFNWLKDPVNRKLLTSGAEVAKELLLEAGHKSATSGH